MKNKYPETTRIFASAFVQALLAGVAFLIGWVIIAWLL